MSPQLQARDLLAKRVDSMCIEELKLHINQLREVHEMLCAFRQAPGVSANSRFDAIHLSKCVELQIEQARLQIEEIQADDAHAPEEEHEHDEAQSRLAPKRF